MRIIESRKPKKEKEVICNNCKSKLGYIKSDIITNSESNYKEDFCYTKEYIVCPICRNHIILNKNKTEKPLDR